MLRSSLSSIVLAALLSLSATADETNLESEAEALASAFVSKLKPTLKQAMQTGGPVAAIDVCAKAAPEIAGELSRTSGWQVSRVSLKPRNLSTATPDAWTRNILESFDERRLGGEPASNINHAETVGNEFRYLQAQAAEGICLVCHGTEISAPVRKQLALQYPRDRAQGYSLGDIRGAIYLRKPIGGTP